MILNPVIVGGSGAEPEETPDLYITVEAFINAGTESLDMSGPNGVRWSAPWDSVDERYTYHLFVNRYGTYTFTKDDGKEGESTSKVTFEKGGPTKKSVNL